MQSLGFVLHFQSYQLGFKNNKMLKIIPVQYAAETLLNPQIREAKLLEVIDSWCQSQISPGQSGYLCKSRVKGEKA